MGLRGKHTKIFVDGYALTTKIQEITPFSISADEIEDSGYTQDHSTMKGQFNSELGFNGYFDPNTGLTHDAMKNAGTDGAVPCSVIFGENATPARGDISFSLNGEQTMYEIVPNLAGVIAATAAWKQTGIAGEFGIMLEDTTQTATANGTSVDQTAGTTNGAVGYAHVTAVSTGDTLTLKIQDSPDNAAWADLITFTLDGSAVNGERVAVTGNVDRYIRAIWTIGGVDPSFTFAVFFVRK